MGIYERPPLLSGRSQGQAEINMSRHEQNSGKMIASALPQKDTHMGYL